MTLSEPPRGFTLTELLVVIALLGTLSALLLPGLSHAKNKAQQILCISNLRQINAAVRMYADDSNDSLPPSRDRPDFTGYMALMKGYMATGAGHAGFACPADTFYYDIPTMARAYRIPKPLHAQPGMNWTSYGFNAGNFRYGASASPRWPGVAGWKSSSVRDPGQTLLVVEFPALQPYSWHRPAPKPGHHNNAQCVVSFVDGHVSYLRMYWDAANAKGDHLESWQYDPPGGYSYKWSGN